MATAPVDRADRFRLEIEGLEAAARGKGAPRISLALGARAASGQARPTLVVWVIAEGVDRYLKANAGS